MKTRPLGFLPVLLWVLLSGAAWLHADTVEKDGRIHVRYWEKWVSFEGEAMQAAVEQFNRSQDRIVVEYLPVSQIDRKLIVATAGGDPPDVAGIWGHYVATFADAGALESFDRFLVRDGMDNKRWLERYFPVFARICSHGGHVYAGISTPATIAFYWNKTLFREAGLDPERPPATLEELNRYARKLTRRDPKTGALLQVGFLPQDPGWWPWVFCRWFGGELFDGNQVTLASDVRNLEALRWIQSFSKDLGGEQLKVFASGFGSWASPQAPFFSGKVAMVFQGVWYDNYIRQYKPGLDYGVGPWPEAVSGVKDFAMAEADVLVIPRGARNPEAAWEFIRFLNEANPGAKRFEELRGSELVCYLQQKISPLRDWSFYFEKGNRHPNIDIFRKLAASANTVSTPDIGIWAEYYREFNAAFERVRLLEAEPEEAIKDADRRLGESWSRYRRSLIRHGQIDTKREDTP